MKKVLGFSWIVFLLSSNFCYAKDSVDLGQLVVTPSRIEESIDDASRKVEIITKEDIEASGAKDISEVLSAFPSVDMTDYGGVGALKNIRMRGATPSQVLVLMDGRPLNSPRDGEVDLSTIPLDNLERIEVMRAAKPLWPRQWAAHQYNYKKPAVTGQKQNLPRGSAVQNFIETLSHGARIGKFNLL